MDARIETSTVRLMGGTSLASVDGASESPSPASPAKLFWWIASASMALATSSWLLLASCWRTDMAAR